jgi:hypothetical protein
VIRRSHQSTVERADAKPAMIAASDSTIGTFMAGSWTIHGDDQTRSAWIVADARIRFAGFFRAKGKRLLSGHRLSTIEFVPNRDEVRTADLSCESVGTVSKFDIRGENRRSELSQCAESRRFARFPPAQRI